MQDKIIHDLPQIFQKHISTLRKTSYDDAQKEYLSQSNLRVINFDKIPNELLMKRRWKNAPLSNDSLYIDKDGWYFIEFKNGNVKKENIYRKIYDSIIVLIELGIINGFEFAREKIQYILVINQNNHVLKSKSESREKNTEYLFRLAQKEEKLFGVETFEQYLLKETHTYTKEQFRDKFEIKMETLEGISGE